MFLDCHLNIFHIMCVYCFFWSLLKGFYSPACLCMEPSLSRAAYLVVATEEFGRQIPFAFLERVRDDFKRRYGGGKADTAIAHALDKDFGYASVHQQAKGMPRKILVAQNHGCFICSAAIFV
jgi:hypothetical protein